jgi:PadR family transcriptional regulator, regulatory protein PadR
MRKTDDNFELTRFEEQILLAVWKLGENAYGITIYQHIRDLTGRDLAIGGIYFPLERLVKKELLEAYQGDPTPVRGGQSKRFYRLTELGRNELVRCREIQTAFWAGLPAAKMQGRGSR